MRNVLTNLAMLIRSIRLGIVVAIAHYRTYRIQSKVMCDEAKLKANLAEITHLAEDEGIYD